MNGADTRKARALGINHVVLEVDDLDKALEFYDALFEFTLRGKSDRNAFIDLGDQFIQVEIARLQVALPGVGAGQGEEVFDDLVQTASLFVDDRQRFMVFARFALRALDHHFRRGVNHAQRRSQFVRSVGHKLSLLRE